MSHETSALTRFGVVRQYPVDLAVVSLGAIVAYWAITTHQAGSALRLIATVPLTLFLPGYALVSVLFPASERNVRIRDRVQESASTSVEATPRGIDVAERLGLSFVLSIAIMPILGLVLPLTQWAFGTVPTAGALATTAVVLAQLGVVRRLRTPQSDRFTVSPIAWITRFRGEQRGISASSVLLVLAIGTAMSALLLGFLAPVSTGGFTELALYGENEDGELVAGSIDDEIAPGESVPVTVSIENHEGEATTYTVVVQQQRVEDGTVVERTELDEREATVADEETETIEVGISPTVGSGETVRISVLLYDGDPPAEPTNDNAEEETYFWLTVEE